MLCLAQSLVRHNQTLGHLEYPQLKLVFENMMTSNSECFLLEYFPHADALTVLLRRLLHKSPSRLLKSHQWNWDRGQMQVQNGL